MKKGRANVISFARPFSLCFYKTFAKEASKLNWKLL